MKSLVKIVLTLFMLLACYFPFWMRGLLLDEKQNDMSKYLNMNGYTNVEFVSSNSFTNINTFKASNATGEIKVTMIGDDAFQERPFVGSKLKK